MKTKNKFCTEFNTNLKKFNIKVIVSGDFVEVCKYSKGVFLNFSKNGKLTLNNKDLVVIGDKIINNRTGEIIVESIEARRKAQELINLNNVRSEIRRIINANAFQYRNKKGYVINPKFLTLTFKENIQDVKTANYEFMKFIQRLNWIDHQTKKHTLKYLCVIEFQDGKKYKKMSRRERKYKKQTGRGAVHYHVALFNLAWLPKKDILERWGNGWVHIKNIKDVDNVGAYISKYMQKSQGVDKRLKGKKKYFCSRNLKGYEIYYYSSEYDNKLKQYEIKIKDFEVSKKNSKNDYLGDIEYINYDLSGRRNKNACKKCGSKDVFGSTPETDRFYKCESCGAYTVKKNY